MIIEIGITEIAGLVAIFGVLIGILGYCIHLSNMIERICSDISHIQNDLKQHEHMTTSNRLLRLEYAQFGAQGINLNVSDLSVSLLCENTDKILSEKKEG